MPWAEPFRKEHRRLRASLRHALVVAWTPSVAAWVPWCRHHAAPVRPPLRSLAGAPKPPPLPPRLSAAAVEVSFQPLALPPPELGLCLRGPVLSRALAPVPGCVNFPFPSQLPVTRSPAQTSMRRTLPRRGLNKPRAQNPSAAPIACAPRLMPFPQLLPTLTTCSPHGAERRAPVRPGLSCFPGARPSDLDPWGRAQGPAHSRECGRWFRLPRNQAPWAPVGEWARKPMEDALGKVRLNSRTWRSLATRAVLTSEEIARGYYGPGSSSEPAPPGEFRREAGCRTHSDAWF